MKTNIVFIVALIVTLSTHSAHAKRLRPNLKASCFGLVMGLGDGNAFENIDQVLEKLRNIEQDNQIKPLIREFDNSRFQKEIWANSPSTFSGQVDQRIDYVVESILKNRSQGTRTFATSSHMQIPTGNRYQPFEIRFSSDSNVKFGRVELIPGTHGLTRLVDVLYDDSFSIFVEIPQYFPAHVRASVKFSEKLIENLKTAVRLSNHSLELTRDISETVFFGEGNSSNRGFLMNFKFDPKNPQDIQTLKILGYLISLDMARLKMASW